LKKKLEVNRIAIIYDDIFLLHDTGAHIENAERLKALIPAIKNSHLSSEIDWFSPVAATEEEITSIHSPEMIEFIKQKISEGGGMLDPDTVVSPGSLNAAMAAAGSGKVALGLIFKMEYRRVFIPVRPPGHHATSSRSMGFCLFNNIAICANIALDYGMAKKIAIIDWDIHHGNGIEEIFYTDDRVLYMSIHQSPLFPGTGYIQDRGLDRGKGYTLNAPLPPGAGNDEYIKILNEKFRPAIEEFKPDLFILSAGFDGHRNDPVGNHNLDEDGYKKMASIIREMADQSPADGRLITFLEGGYHHNSLVNSVIAMLSSWVNDIPPNKGENVLPAVWSFI